MSKRNKRKEIIAAPASSVTAAVEPRNAVLTESSALAQSAAFAQGAVHKPLPADPTLLGVEVPLNLTFETLRQLGDAWLTCLVSLRAALRTRFAREIPVANVEV